MIGSLWDFVCLFVVLVSLWKRTQLKNLIALLYKKFTMKKKKLKPKPTNPSLFLLLPDDVVLNCFSRIVCKTFRDLIVSNKLHVERLHLKTREEFFNVCLQFPNNPRPSLFALWIKPDQILTNQLEKKTSTRNTRLVQIPSSYYSFVLLHTVTVASEVYAFNEYNGRSSMMWVRNNENYGSRIAHNMIVAREKALSAVLNGKIYVIGSCAKSANWGEVFDPKTQNWEPLPDPGAELRFSSIRKIEVIQGKLYVRSNENKDSVYDPKEGKWDVAQKSCVGCVIENVSYCCDKHKCLWYDKNRQEWRVVSGLGRLNRNLPGSIIEIANYGGKLLILWEKFVDPGSCEDKDIWGAMISVEKCDDTDEVWGNIEWANVVLTVPSSCVFVHSRINIH